ncbi:MAG: RimK/LysX family protein [Thiohalophilus sp.]
MTTNKSFNYLIDNKKWLAGLLGFVLLYSPISLQAGQKQIIGWVEPVNIPYRGTDLHFSAKIDTGADYSSIDVESLELVSRGDQTWVRFELEDDDGHLAMIEEPLYKMTKVKRKGSASQPRVVVLLDICLNGFREKARISLVDRHNYKYRMLIGRQILSGRFLVDAELKNSTIHSNCPNPGE